MSLQPVNSQSAAHSGASNVPFQGFPSEIDGLIAEYFTMPLPNSEGAMKYDNMHGKKISEIESALVDLNNVIKITKGKTPKSVIENAIVLEQSIASRKGNVTSVCYGFFAQFVPDIPLTQNRVLNFARREISASHLLASSMVGSCIFRILKFID